MTDKINEEFKKALISKIPSGDLGSGEDVSNCVAFSIDMSKYINAKPFILMAECICLDNSY